MRQNLLLEMSIKSGHKININRDLHKTFEIPGVPGVCLCALIGRNCGG